MNVIIIYKNSEVLSRDTIAFDLRLYGRYSLRLEMAASDTKRYHVNRHVITAGYHVPLSAKRARDPVRPVNVSAVFVFTNYLYPIRRL